MVVDKFIFTLTFVIPVLLFNIGVALKIGILWGISILTIVSYIIAKKRKVHPSKVIFEHLIIAFIVIIITYYLGKIIGNNFP